MRTGGGVVQSPQRQIRDLTTEELARLRRHAEAQAVQARENGGVTAVRSWALLDTLLSSGLRASEVAGDGCGTYWGTGYVASGHSLA